MKYTLSFNDLINGAKTAVFVAILGAMYTMALQPHFSLFTTDWVSVGKSMADLGYITFLGYIVRKFLENSDGKLLASEG